MGVCVNECPRYRSCFSLCFIFLNYILFPIYILKDSSSFWANLLWQIVQLVKVLPLGDFDTSHFSVETFTLGHISFGILELQLPVEFLLLKLLHFHLFRQISFGIIRVFHLAHLYLSSRSKSPLALSESTAGSRYHQQSKSPLALSESSYTWLLLSIKVTSGKEETPFNLLRHL